MKSNARSEGGQGTSVMGNPLLLKSVVACMLWLSAVLFGAFFCSTALAENYTIKIGFEEFVENDHTQIVDQYASQGVHFQDLGDGNGSISFRTGTIAPFGDVNWQGFPAIGLGDVGIPYNHWCPK